MIFRSSNENSLLVNKASRIKLEMEVICNIWYSGLCDIHLKGIYDNNVKPLIWESNSN